MIPTVIVTPTDLDDAEVRLVGDSYHHLFRVRRLSAGDEVRLVDGAGRARRATVGTVTREHALLLPGDPAPANEPPYPVEVLVGALRRERASWLVEKATELGAGAVRFVASERSPRQFGAGTFDRLRRVARAAVEQCGRARVPELSGVHPWDEVPELLAAAGEPWLLDPGASTPLAAARGPSVLLVGPEGGWSDAECDALAAVGCRRASLGRRTLRVETAALAGLARLLPD